MAGAGDARFAQDPVSEVRTDGLVRHAVERIQGDDADGAVSKLLDMGEAAGEHGIGVTWQRHPPRDGGSPAGRQGIEFVDAPGALTADGVAVMRGSVSGRIVHHRDEITREKGSGGLIESGNGGGQRVCGGCGDVPSLSPGQNALQTVGAHALMLSRVSTYGRQLPLLTDWGAGAATTGGAFGLGAGFAAGAGITGVRAGTLRAGRAAPDLPDVTALICSAAFVS